MLLLTDSEWSPAKMRSEIIAQLAKEEVVGLMAAEEATVRLGRSRRQVYRLVTQYRMGCGLVTDMAPNSPPGGKGKSRIAPEVEVIIADVLKSLYLSRQRRSRAVITREIRIRYQRAGHQAPTYSTVDA